MERHSQWLVAAFITSGMLFMLFPGTFLGVWNLIGISQQQTPEGLSPAWLQAHGHAQLFGWLGSFILGIGFYSLTKIQSTLTFPVRTRWTVWALWTLGVTLRWTSTVTGRQWRILLPLSRILGLVPSPFSIVQYGGPPSERRAAKRELGDFGFRRNDRFSGRDDR
jgi:hypothetical protein